MRGSKSDKIWADALKRAVNRESEGKGSPKWLNVIADQVVSLAAGGDMAAVREIGDRVDGKPKQALDVESPKGSMTPKVIERIIVRPSEK